MTGVVVGAGARAPEQLVTPVYCSPGYNREEMGFGSWRVPYCESRR
jgi:hypothetical protein